MTNNNDTWSEFYQHTEGHPPWGTLLKAIENSDSDVPPTTPRFAVDLGCGTGRDTLALLQHGWRVLAIDSQPEAITRIEDTFSDDFSERLQTQVMDFADLVLPTADLINASFSLPFCPHKNFEGMWQTIVDSLRPGGRFSGQLFGNHDQWVTSPIENIPTTHHTRAQVEALLANFEIEFIDEIDRLGSVASGEEKYWHVFHIVAKYSG